MNENTLESFINYCDEMQIANESFLTSIKNKLKKAILTFIRWVEEKVKKIKNDKIRKALLTIIKKAKKLLGDTESINESNVTEKSSEINSNLESLKKDVEEVVGVDDDPKNEDLDDRVISENIYVKVLRKNKSGRSQYFYQVLAKSDEIMNQLIDHLDIANNAKSFNNYIKHYKEFKKMICLPDKCTVYNLVLNADNTISCYYIIENTRPKKTMIDKPLYHTSKDPNLTHIIPNWRAERSERDPYSGRWFDTPRAFFGIFPMDRYGYKIDSTSNTHVYKADNIKNAYIDIDGIKYGTSVYVEGEQPIPLTKIS